MTTLVSDGRFEVVFRYIGKTADDAAFVAEAEALRLESEEVAELRRLTREATDPEPVLYTRS